MDDKPIRAQVLLGLGLADLAQASHPAIDETRQRLIESLKLPQEMGEQLPLISSLIGIAWLEQHDGSAHSAAQPLGAVDSALNEFHAAAEPEMLYFHAKMPGAVRDLLGDTAFNSAGEEGPKWSLDDAVNHALEGIRG